MNQIRTLAERLTNLIFQLWGHRSQSDVRRTKALLSRVINVSIGGGAVTAAVASFNVVVFFAAKPTDFFVPPAIILSKLYSNSLLVQLNAPVRITRPGEDRDENLTVELGSNYASPIKRVALERSLDTLSPASDRRSSIYNGPNDLALNSQVLPSKHEEVSSLTLQT